MNMTPKHQNRNLPRTIPAPSLTQTFLPDHGAPTGPAQPGALSSSSGQVRAGVGALLSSGPTAELSSHT